jgi:hypothetical protein
LAEAFEDDGDGIKAGFEGLYLCQLFIQFSGNLFLFG